MLHIHLMVLPAGTGMILYEGVGGHLFSIACKEAVKIRKGYVVFDLKTSLISYYKRELVLNK